MMMLDAVGAVKDIITQDVFKNLYVFVDVWEVYIDAEREEYLLGTKLDLEIQLQHIEPSLI